MAVTQAQYTGGLDVERGIINFAVADSTGTLNTDLDYIMGAIFACIGTTAPGTIPQSLQIVPGVTQLTGTSGTVYGVSYAGIPTAGTVRLQRDTLVTVNAASFFYTLYGYAS